MALPYCAKTLKEVYIMKLFNLLQGLNYTILKGKDIEINHMTYSSKEVVEGSLFLYRGI